MSCSLALLLISCICAVTDISH